MDKLLEGYGDAKKAADDYLAAVDKLPEGAVASDLASHQGGALDNLKIALGQLQQYRDELSTDLTQGVAQFGSQGAADSVAHLVDVVREAGLSASSTKAQFDALITALVEIKNGSDQFGPTEAFLAGKMLDLVTNAEKARTAVESIGVALNALPSSVAVQIEVQMKNFDAARTKLLGLVPDTRDQFTRARDGAKAAYSQEVGAAPDAIMRQAAGYDYAKVLSGIDAAEKAAAGKKSASAADSAAARQQKTIDSITASLKNQLAALTNSDREQAIANELTRSHVTAASADGQKISALAGALYDQRQAQTAVNDATRLFAETAESSLAGVLSGTETLNQAMGDLLSTLGEALLKAALLGEGPLAGLLGTAPAQTGGVGGLFGDIASALIPGRASGGPVSAGQPYIVGEKRPELFVPNTAGRIIPDLANMSLPSGGSGSVHVTYAPQIDAQGADSSAVAKLAQVVAQDRAEFQSKVIGTIRQARKQRAL